MKRKSDKTAAVIGMGYVGIPVACFFAKAGYKTYGLDRSQKKIDTINSGAYPIKGVEPGMPELVKEVVESGNLTATANKDVLREASVIAVCVDTPIDEGTNRPSYVNLKTALTDVGQRLNKGDLVVIESTIAPLTIENIAKVILEKESGLSADDNEFYLANAPERVMPGLLIDRLENHPRVIGGWTEEAARAAHEVYGKVFPVAFDVTDSLTAELVKTTENTYRDAQIALANQVALVAESVGGDFWKVKELVNKVIRRDLHDAGAGVGGHCIPKDSWLLINESRDKTYTKLIEDARYINEFMPQHMVDLTKEGLSLAEKKLKGSKVAILGYAYNGNSDDSRHTPAQSIIKILKKEGAEYAVHDPFVEGADETILKDIDEAVAKADAVLLVTAHDSYRDLNWAELSGRMNDAPVLVDGRNLYNQEKLRGLGFIYLGVGKPHPVR